MRLLQRNIYRQVDRLLFLKKDEELKGYLTQQKPHEIADVIDHLTRGKRKVFRMLEGEIAAEVLFLLNDFSTNYIVRNLPKRELMKLFTYLTPDRVVDVLQYAHHTRPDLLEIVAEKKKPVVEKLLRYDPESAGGIVNPSVIVMKTTDSVGEAIELVQQKSEELDHLYQIYVVDMRERLKGVIPVNDLFAAPKRRRLGALVLTELPRITPQLDQEQLVRMFRESNMAALPVTDSEGKLLGEVNFMRILEVLEEEATEDIYKLGGVLGDESVTDPAMKSVRQRLPWLLLNIGTALLSSFVVSLFTDTIHRIVMVAAFMPVVAGLGGNAATQTLAITVRAISLGEMHWGNIGRVVGKEIFTGIVKGFVAGVALGAIALFWMKDMELAIVLFLSLMLNIVLAGVMGSLIPITLKSFRIDPAIASSIFITAFTDIVGFFAFLGLATWML